MMRSLVFSMVFGVAAQAWALAPREIYNKSGAAVVLILSSDDGKTGSGGTGSIITSKGEIITNGHVILNSSGVPYKTIYVYLKPAKITGDNSLDLQQRYTARVKAYSPATQLDLALLQIEDAPSGLPVVQFGDPNDVNIGDPVVAVGHPEQGGLWTLTTGTISTVMQNFDRIKGKHVFQTEASFNRGNSGGPLFNEHGDMVGINTMIARRAADGLAITAVNFSLKSSVAVDWLKQQSLSLAYAPSTGGSNSQMAQNTTPPPATATKTPPPVQETPVPTAPVANNEQVNKSQSVPQGAKIQTEKKPFNMDNLLRDQMKEMDDMMSEMRGKTRSKMKGF